MTKSSQSTCVDAFFEMAASQPDHPALMDSGGGGEVGYGEMADAARKIKEEHLAAGARTGDRCGLQMASGVSFIREALGILASGQCLVPVSGDYEGKALEEFADRTQLHRLVMEQGGRRSVSVFSEKRDVDGEGDRLFRALNPGFIRFTSGTTRKSKGVVISHEAIWRRMCAANRGLCINSSDRVFWLLPMEHHFLVSVLLYLTRGATLVLPASGRPVALEDVLNSQATLIYAAPENYNEMLTDQSAVDLSSVRLALSTSSRLAETLAGRWLKQTRIPLVQALGLIEVGLPLINLSHAVEKPGCVGQVLPDYEVRLRHCEGLPLDVSGIGEILVSGPGMFAAYLSPWKLAEEVFEEGFFPTGDLGHFDEDGDLFILGRRHNRISRKGKKFFCEEVEAVINMYPGVRESRVFERTSGGSSCVAAEMVIRDGLDREQIRTFCQERLSRYKVPDEFHVVSEIAKTPTGKIRRW